MGAASDDNEDETPEPVFKNVGEFVSERFLPMYCRSAGGRYRWCRQWWRHPEAVSRLRAIWHSWEVLRWESGTGISVWYRDHLDYHIEYLMGSFGPFRECTPHRHHEPEPLPADAPPDGFFDDEW